MTNKYKSLFFILVIICLIVTGCSNNKKTLNEDQITNKKNKSSYITFEIKGKSPWRGVYGNAFGMQIIKGENSYRVKINNNKPVVATIQNLGDTELKMNLIKDDKTVDSKTIKKKYMSSSLIYGMNSDFSSDIRENQLNPLGDEDGDGDKYRLNNYNDPLPKQFGTVTESEYKELLKSLSKKMINVMDEAISTVSKYNKGRINKEKYFDKLGSYSQFSSSPNNDEYDDVLEVINNIIAPKKYMKDEYFWKAITDIGVIFDNFANGDSELNNGRTIKQNYFDGVIDNLEKAYSLSQVNNIQVLRKKLISFRKKIPDSP